jgi:hypothetical protein
MARSNPNSTPKPPLTEDQLQAISELKAERAIYEKQLNKAMNKRNKIKEIIDNFESVILGDILINLLPDETSEEIVNSIIISKNDIKNALSGIDTTEITEEVTSGFGNYAQTTTVVTGTVSGYTGGGVDSANTLLNNIFNNSVVREIINISPILNDDELYAPIIYEYIETLQSGVVGKEILRNIVNNIETKTTEPPTSALTR